jgi:hypothetical protein
MGTLTLDTSLQDLSDGAVKRFDLIVMQPVRLAQRVDARPVQGFIGIDIAHAGQKTLVEKQRFDNSWPLPEPRGEFLQGEFVIERLRAEGGCHPMSRLDQVDTAEFPHVVEPQFLPVIQGECDTIMRLARTV